MCPKTNNQNQKAGSSNDCVNLSSLLKTLIKSDRYIIAFLIAFFSSAIVPLASSARDASPLSCHTVSSSESCVETFSAHQGDTNPLYGANGYLLLLGAGLGGLTGAAIAFYRRSHISSSSSPYPCQLTFNKNYALSSKIDLSQFCSSAEPLTSQQRAILECIWLMAAIAPHPDSTFEYFYPTPLESNTLDWCINQIQSKAIAFDELADILTEMGFSKPTVQKAWEIIHSFQICNPVSEVSL